jgi:hypothetical protein
MLNRFRARAILGDASEAGFGLDNPAQALAEPDIVFDNRNFDHVYAFD